MNTSKGGGTEWYVAVDGKRMGPMPLDRLVRGVELGKIDDRDFAWREGMAKWLPLLEVAEIDSALLAAGVHLPGPGARDDRDEPSAALRAVLPVGRTGLALAAGYLGLASILLFPPVGPVAIVVSVLAIRDLKKRPGTRGMGRAIFGIIGGFIGIAICVAIAISLD